MDVLQRLTWNGTPKEMGDLLRLTKNGREARAVLYSHVFGWEVRLLVGRQLEAVRTQVCRSKEDVLSTGEEWKAAMLADGWNS
jgi:hypothetical protein